MVSRVMLILFILSAILWQSQSEFLPDCLARCGDLQIPYPFGTSEGCYYSPRFLITCNTSFNPPKAFLQKSGIDVTYISTDGEIQILEYNAQDCYNQTGHQLVDYWTWLKLHVFSISHTKNILATIGCDTYASLVGFNKDDKRLEVKCGSICDKVTDVRDGVCNGIGCCEVDLPVGMKNFSLTIRSNSNHTGVWDFNPCGYAFVVDKTKFNFTSRYLSNYTDELLPIMLDWVIENVTCEEAQKKPNYACKENSSCYELPSLNGYRCKCLDGYQGNPYLNNGCQKLSLSLNHVDP